MGNTSPCWKLPSSFGKTPSGAYICCLIHPVAPYFLLWRSSFCCPFSDRKSALFPFCGIHLLFLPPISTSPSSGNSKHIFVGIPQSCCLRRIVHALIYNSQSAWLQRPIQEWTHSPCQVNETWGGVCSVFLGNSHLRLPQPQDGPVYVKSGCLSHFVTRKQACLTSVFSHFLTTMAC